MIENRVEKSGLITFNLEDVYPKGERITFDIADVLFQGLILREKDFREFIKTNDWSFYKDKYVALVCTADAIVPVWAYMLLATALEPFAKKVVFGSLETLETVIFTEALSQLNLTDYQDERVIIKGCSKYPVPISAYVNLTSMLKAVAKSVMYGEACSTVPIYKK
jgi:hypothetical protein